MQNKLKIILENNENYSYVQVEKNNVDIRDKFNKKDIFFELKTSSVKLAIREAIGQLLEYVHYANKKPDVDMVVVT